MEELFGVPIPYWRLTKFLPHERQPGSVWPRCYSALMLLDAEMNAQLENYKPQSIRLQADRSQWVSEEPLLPTMSQEALWATDVHRALSRATLQSQTQVGR